MFKLNIKKSASKIKLKSKKTNRKIKYLLIFIKQIKKVGQFKK